MSSPKTERRDQVAHTEVTCSRLLFEVSASIGQGAAGSKARFTARPQRPICTAGILGHVMIDLVGVIGTVCYERRCTQRGIVAVGMQQDEGSQRPWPLISRASRYNFERTGRTNALQLTPTRAPCSRATFALLSPFGASTIRRSLGGLIHVRARNLYEKAGGRAQSARRSSRLDR